MESIISALNELSGAINLTTMQVLFANFILLGVIVALLLRTEVILRRKCNRLMVAIASNEKIIEQKEKIIEGLRMDTPIINSWENYKRLNSNYIKLINDHKELRKELDLAKNDVAELVEQRDYNIDEVLIVKNKLNDATIKLDQLTADYRESTENEDAQAKKIITLQKKIDRLKSKLAKATKNNEPKQ